MTVLFSRELAPRPCSPNLAVKVEVVGGQPTPRRCEMISSRIISHVREVDTSRMSPRVLALLAAVSR